MKPLHNKPRNARELYQQMVLGFRNHIEWNDLSEESMLYWNKAFKERRDYKEIRIVDDSHH